MRRIAGDRWGQVASQNNLAALAFETDDYALARTGWLAALSEAESIGALPLAALILTNLGELALTETKLEEARSRLENALEIIDDIEDRHLETECCRHLAALEAQTGKLDLATVFARRALDVAKRAGLVEREALAHLQLGEIFSANLYDADAEGSSGGSPAAKAFATAVKLAKSIGNDATIGRTLFAHGRFKAEQGQIADGRDLLRDALTVFSRLGLSRQATDVERLLATLQ
jgi:tetratricopeptide (TPR) repeat protein